MADSSYGAPQASSGGGVGGFFADNPWAKWVALGGVALVAFWFVRRRQSAQTVGGVDTTATTAGLPGTVTGYGSTATYAIDPATGIPINPATGQDFGQIGSASSDIGAWISSALKNLPAGVDPLNAENAIYRFVNGMGLTSDQQAIISALIAKIGNPPGGPYPVVTTSGGTTPAAPTGVFQPLTWKWVTGQFPAQLATNTGNMISLGFKNFGTILNVAAGSPIYALETIKGKRVWVRISSLTQWLNLPTKTQIATLRGEQVATRAA